MRKRYRVLVLAAIVGAIIVPLGFALSFETESGAFAPPPGIVAATRSTTVVSSVLISAGDPPARAVVHSVPDGAKLLFVGTMLFGLAAAVRKTF